MGWRTEPRGGWMMRKDRRRGVFVHALPFDVQRSARDASQILRLVCRELGIGKIRFGRLKEIDAIDLGQQDLLRESHSAAILTGAQLAFLARLALSALLHGETTARLLGRDALDLEHARHAQLPREEDLDLSLRAQHLLAGHASVRTKANAHEAWAHVERTGMGQRAGQERLTRAAQRLDEVHPPGSRRQGRRT